MRALMVGAWLAVGALVVQPAMPVPRSSRPSSLSRPPCSPEIGEDEMRAIVRESLGVEILRVEVVERDGEPAYAITVMNPQGNQNDALRVATLLFDGATGSLLGTATGGAAHGCARPLDRDDTRRLRERRSGDPPSHPALIGSPWSASASHGLSDWRRSVPSWRRRMAQTVAETTLDEHGGPVKGVAVSADGRRALTASFDYSVILWDLQAGAPLAHLYGHDAAVNDIAFLPGNRAISASDDGTLAIWDLAGERRTARLTGHSGKVAAIATTPDGAARRIGRLGSHGTRLGPGDRHAGPGACGPRQRQCGAVLAGRQKNPRRQLGRQHPDLARRGRQPARGAERPRLCRDGARSVGGRAARRLGLGRRDRAAVGSRAGRARRSPCSATWGRC